MKYRLLSAVLAALAVVACLGGCSKSDVPNGMKLASRENAPYRYYVPRAWIVDIDDAASAEQSLAHSVEPQPLTVSVLMVDSAGAPEDYWNGYAALFAETYADFAVVTRESVTVSEKDAFRAVFTGKIDETEYSFVQYLIPAGGRLCLVSFSCASEVYADNTETIGEIIAHFELTDAPSADPTGDAGAWRTLTNDIVDYEIDVPENWTNDLSGGALSAVAPDKTSVSVMAWDIQSMDNALDDWFKGYEESLRLAASAYTVASETETKLGGEDAVLREIRATVAGEDVVYYQTVTARRYMIYLVTFTCRASAFEALRATFDASLATFTFR